MAVEVHSSALISKTATAKRARKRSTIEDAKRWAEMYSHRMSVLKIAKEEQVNPSVVSSWLKRLGIEIGMGHHFVQQPKLRLSEDLLSLISQGPTALAQRLRSTIWGIQFSPFGMQQLEKFCKFVELYHQRVGVEEIAEKLGIHRSTVAKWRNGTDQPYLIRTANEIFNNDAIDGHMLLPLELSSGGNSLNHWIQVPAEIKNYEDLVRVIYQLNPNEDAFKRGTVFCISRPKLQSLRMELVGYLLGVMLGDASKLGGEQSRFTSSNLDLQLTTKQPSNDSLGEFVCMCVNMLGLPMGRIANKKPSGTTRFGKQPSEAFRWNSERSPILAWLYNVCLGLSWEQNTSNDMVKMDWILGAPPEFRKRFIQGVADSDATVKPYEVVITSVPNAEFMSSLLRSLGLSSAHVVVEGGRELRTMVSRRQGSTLPIFNEYVKGYRYQKLMAPFKK